jgi:L-asparaginase
MRLLVVETGGTINGILDPRDPPPQQSRVMAWLESNSERLGLQLSCNLLLMKDSRALDEADRARLVAAVEAASEDRLLIPHGTYTMPETGVYLREHLSAAARAKRVVLVGAMIPLGDADSDAPAALDFALETLRRGPRGVWIAMGGQLWHPREVTKDEKSGRYIRRVEQ